MLSYWVPKCFCAIACHVARGQTRQETFRHEGLELLVLAAPLRQQLAAVLAPAVARHPQLHLAQSQQVQLAGPVAVAVVRLGFARRLVRLASQMLGHLRLQQGVDPAPRLLQQHPSQALALRIVEVVRFDAYAVHVSCPFDCSVATGAVDVSEAAQPSRLHSFRPSNSLILSTRPVVFSEAVYTLYAALPVRGDHVSIRQRVYRGIIDTPKSEHSARDVAIPDRLQSALVEWRTLVIDSSPEAWVFSSEANSPLSRDNVWRRHFKPRLEKVGLEWATFQVMRRTHSTLMQELGADPKLVADQQGHTVDVNLNVYTRSSIGARKAALQRLENRLFPALTMPN